MRLPNQAHLEPFPATQWTLVARAGQTATAQQAMTQLLPRYLEAMRSHLILMRRLAPERAEDLLQGFVASQVLERRLIRRAERGKGRFRSFLLVALDRYVSNQFRDGRVAKRAPDRAGPFPDGAQVESRDSRPEAVFELGWARQVLQDALRRMRKECSALQRDDIWGVLDARIVRPAFERVEPLSYGRLIEQFGFASPSQASNVLITAKRMLARCLREVVGEYEFDPAKVEREILDLHEILGRRPM